MRDQAGQTLVEMVVAIAVLIVVILALLSITTTSIRNASFSRDQVLATKYAQEAMEKVRSWRDQNSWNDFLSACITPSCGSILSGASYPSPFGWNCNCTCTGGESCEVTIIVSWADVKGRHQSELKTRLTNWK